MSFVEQSAVLGSLGEFVGSITVLVTLIYLAIQTRQINLQGQAEARYAFVDAMAEINMVIAQDKNTASVWRRGLESIEALDDDERMQFFMLVGQYANAWAVMFQLHRDSMLPDTQWLIVRNDILSILSSDGGATFWRTGGRAAFDSDFVHWVDGQLADHERPYDMTGMVRSASDPS